jgi:hypothetical protein
MRHQRLRLAATFAIAALLAAPAVWSDDDLTLDSAVGGAIGGAIGGAVGAELGGREGAVIGAGVGAATGTAINTRDHVEAGPREGRAPALPTGPGVGRFCPPGQAKKGRC